MKEEKTCGNCGYSFLKKDEPLMIPGVPVIRHCKSPDYNSDAYTEEMLLEDRSGGHRRFWIPKILKARND